MLLFWALGLLAMWARARYTMHLRNRTTVAGEHKATLELAASMVQELTPDNTDLLSLSEQQIKKRIRGVRGGNIAYSSSIVERRYSWDDSSSVSDDYDTISVHANR
jgi:hypothetical protein